VVVALSEAAENPAQASDARARSANTSKSCKSPRFERQDEIYKCIAADLQDDIGVGGDAPARFPHVASLMQATVPKP
jgi:hypothetical protein